MLGGNTFLYLNLNKNTSKHHIREILIIHTIAIFQKSIKKH